VIEEGKRDDPNDTLNASDEDEIHSAPLQNEIEDEALEGNVHRCVNSSVFLPKFQPLNYQIGGP
jgi:hypothetical protein